ncbi:MAG: hypothetical protein AAF431_19980 [Pseudomonadota bacterium]
MEDSIFDQNLMFVAIMPGPVRIADVVLMVDADPLTGTVFTVLVPLPVRPTYRVVRVNQPRVKPRGYRKSRGRQLAISNFSQSHRKKAECYCIDGLVFPNFRELTFCNSRLASCGLRLQAFPSAAEYRASCFLRLDWLARVRVTSIKVSS